MAYKLNFASKDQDWLKAKLSEVEDQIGAAKIATAANAGDQGGSFKEVLGLQYLRQLLILDLLHVDPDGGPGGGWAYQLDTNLTKAVFVSR